MAVVDSLGAHLIQERTAVPTEPILRLSVAQYHQMIATGILTEDAPVELLNGWLVEKKPKNPPHRLATRKTRIALERLLPAGWYADTQEPITTETSEPEPDVVVIRGEAEHFAEHHPGPRDISLLVEVADSSLTRDRGAKKQLYALNRISIYWIVNLLENIVEVYTEPSGETAAPDYGQRRDYSVLDEVPLLIDGRELGRLAVRELLP